MNQILSFIKSILPLTCHDRVVLVGGTVRDMLLGLKGSDIDLVAALTHEELDGLGFRLVSASSGADIYFRHHLEFGKIEVTRIADMAGLPGDLKRRDFTINAIAMDLDGIYHDPMGGRDDLQAGLLRACGDRSFLDDPLRIFRGFRFESFGWRIAEETRDLLRNGDWQGAFRNMPVERFTNEMLKALSGKYPERFFERMIEFGIGREFLPEIFRMTEVPAGPLQYHPEGDLFTHSIQVLQRVSSATIDPMTRFCAMFHDLGKLSTLPELYPKHHGHEGEGFVFAVEFTRRLAIPAVYRKALAWTCRLHGKANKWMDLRDSTKLDMAEKAIKAGIADILPLVSAADKPGNSPLPGWDAAVRIAGMNSRELGIDQARLQSIPIANRSAFIMHRRVELLRGVEPE